MLSFLLLIPLIQLATLTSAQGVTCVPDSLNAKPKLTTSSKSQATLLPYAQPLPRAVASLVTAEPAR